LLRTTCGGLVRSCATRAAARSSRFSFSSAMHLFRPRNATSAASRI
jgi:hypothetical protein